jgi:hypothetical protein
VVDEADEGRSRAEIGGYIILMATKRVNTTPTLCGIYDVPSFHIGDFDSTQLDS